MGERRAGEPTAEVKLFPVSFGRWLRRPQLKRYENIMPRQADRGFALILSKLANSQLKATALDWVTKLMQCEKKVIQYEKKRHFLWVRYGGTYDSLMLRP
jgi:hypothetical protein